MGDELLQPKPQPPQWAAQFDERTCKHIVYAREYAARFAHGAPGHLDLMTIAALADLLGAREPHDMHLVRYEEGARQETHTEGTAQENLDRLRAEELAAIDAAQRRQTRVNDGRPMLPIARGKAR